MTAFFSESRPSAGVYFTSPVWSREEQLTMASMGALFLGSPPPRWITGSAFSSESRPSAGVYFTSPVWSREEQLTMASMGALFLGSPPPRWITGSPFSRSMAAVSFSLRVGDSDMDLASWLKLMRVSQPSLDTRIPGCATGLGIRSTTVYKKFTGGKQRTRDFVFCCGGRG